MFVPILKKMFPDYAAAGFLIKDDAVGAYRHARKAIDAPTGSLRLDESVRSMLDIDHAIDNVQKLPVGKFLPQVDKYLKGYQSAKAAVELLVGSGVIPGARERVGLQQMIHANESFKWGVIQAKLDNSKFGAKYAAGCLDAALEDATWASYMLRPDLPAVKDLLMGITQLRTQIDKQAKVDDGVIGQVGNLFNDLTQQFQRGITLAEADPAPVNRAHAAAIMAQANVLMTEASETAADLIVDAPEVVDELPVGAK